MNNGKENWKWGAVFILLAIFLVTSNQAYKAIVNQEDFEPPEDWKYGDSYEIEERKRANLTDEEKEEHKQANLSDEEKEETFIKASDTEILNNKEEKQEKQDEDDTSYKSNVNLDEI